jgi:hypothetical protein
MLGQTTQQGYEVSLHCLGYYLGLTWIGSCSQGPGTDLRGIELGRSTWASTSQSMIRIYCNIRFSIITNNKKWEAERNYKNIHFLLFTEASPFWWSRAHTILNPALRRRRFRNLFLNRDLISNSKIQSLSARVNSRSTTQGISRVVRRFITVFTWDHQELDEYTPRHHGICL